MAHIHTQPGQHDLTVSAYIFRTDGTRPRVLLHQHKTLHNWMQIGGHVELHETPWTAIKREIKEESGYEVSQLKLLQPEHTLVDLRDDVSVAHPQPFLFATYPYGAEDHHHTDLAFVFVTNEAPAHPLAEDESSNLRWFTENEVTSLPPDQIFKNVQTISSHIFLKLLPSWKQVDPQNFR